MNDALDRGDFGVARDALDRMSDDELQRLREELGDHIVSRLRGIRRRRRGPKKGRVVVINGIMGAHLYSIDRSGNVDHVWVNLPRLFLGQMARLELTPSGEQVQKRYRIEARRLHKTYLPLVFELERSWDVLHFPFDWRLNMDLEAARLADSIRTWARGEPVHLVAHSMGGVLSRRFIQQFPSVWQSMADPRGLRRGGRLVMMGTPNRGSFAIPAMLTGKDKMVRILSFIDFGESKRRFLRNASSFPGAYQMMPSPLVELNDEHTTLYEPGAWGSHRVIDAHLAMARRFQEDLDPVISPERLVYLAGYGVKTQQRIQITQPGKFRYEVNRNGDGRVPHSLGLLDGVATQWLQEEHGNLPLNDSVIDGIHELLEVGCTALLETTLPAVRSFEETQWVDDDNLVELDDEERAAAETLGTYLRAAGVRGRASARAVTAARVTEDALLDDFLASAPPGAYIASVPIKEKGERRKRALAVEVYWDDIRRVRGDVYCVGHYEGVLPERAEYALDTVVSRSRQLEEMVLRTHTQRGVLRGRLGDVNLYPWARTYDPPRSVAVAGMGYPGQFGEAALRSLARHLTWAVATLPRTETICTVLIGSGEGGLSTRQAVRGMIQGLADALEGGLESSIRRVRFVELFRDKAEAIHKELTQLAAAEDRVELHLDRELRCGTGGRLSIESSIALAAAAVIDATTSSSPSIGRAAATILRRIPAQDGMRDSVRGALEKFVGSREKVEEIASRIRVVLEADVDSGGAPARLSFWRSQWATHVAALTDTAVMPERISRVDPTLLDQLRVRLENPREEDVARYGSLLYRLLVPRDFRSVFVRVPSMVIEVDRPMSTVHWEMLTVDPRSETAWDCLALRFPLARQLRTEYSPPPSLERGASGRLTALVIGDPGDPEEGEHLPGARGEALQVAKLLRGFGVDVTLRVGAPRRGGWGPVSGVLPASRLEVLELLQTKRFDILHYAGHGDFQDDDGLRSGWLFQGGMLTAAELSTVDAPPRLVVANACLSARTSTRIHSGERVAPDYGDAGLLPGLADEFLRRGVRDYVGTAWEIHDEGAVLFATRLYESLSLGATGASRTLGEGLLQARTALAKRTDTYGALWAAYQHYGDPMLRI